MPWRAWRFVVIGTIGLAAGVGCARSRDGARRDTLFVGPAVPATTVPAPGIDSGTALTPPDTLAVRLHAFVGFSSASFSATLPELAMVAPDGRRVGFDPATRRTVSELPGAAYESDPVLDDDDGPPDESASASASESDEPVIDVRTLTVPMRVGDAYTLEVTAQEAGSFHLNVGLEWRRGDGSEPLKPRVWRDTSFALRRGEVRRVLVRAGDGTLEVRPDTSARQTPRPRTVE